MTRTVHIMVRVMFHGDLKELLDKEQRSKQSALKLSFQGTRSLNDLIQSLRVPHTEIGEIRVNGKPANSDDVVQGGETIEAFPVSAKHFEKNRPRRFVCDVHLWTLARRLRLLGFDTAFDKKWEDPELAEISQKENRMLLSRDRGLLMRNQVESGLLIRNTDPERQVEEVLERLGLTGSVRPFTRCLLCNGRLKPVDMESQLYQKKLSTQISEGVHRWNQEFHYCQSCLKVFWKGSHYKKMMEKIRRYRANG